MAKQTEAMTPLDYFNRCFEDFPAEIVKTRKQKNERLTYVEWYNYIARAHKEFQPKGFTTEVRGVHAAGGYLYLVVRVTNLNTMQYHDGLGLAPLEKSKAKGFGGAGPEAFSQGLRRAFACHGMGLPFYMNEDEQIYATDNEEEDEGDENDSPDEAGDAVQRTSSRKARESDDETDEGEGEGDDEAGHRREGSRSGRSGKAERNRKVASGSRKSADADDEDEAEEDEADGDGPSEAQVERLNSLARIFEEGGLDKPLARFRNKFTKNPTKQGASIVIREMKEYLEDNDIDWRDEAVAEGKGE